MVLVKSQEFYLNGDYTIEKINEPSSFSNFFHLFSDPQQIITFTRKGNSNPTTTIPADDYRLPDIKSSPPVELVNMQIGQVISGGKRKSRRNRKSNKYRKSSRRR